MMTLLGQLDPVFSTTWVDMIRLAFREQRPNHPGRLGSEGDCRNIRSASILDLLNPSTLGVVPARQGRHDTARTVDQQFAQAGIAPFGDRPETNLASAGVLPGYPPEPGGKWP